MTPRLGPPVSDRHRPPTGGRNCTPPPHPDYTPCPGTGYCDMYLRRIGYCDMCPPRRRPSSDMFLPWDRALRHVPAQPIPLQRHVPPAGPPTATCSRPPDPAPATCSSHGTGYCDMWPSSRPPFPGQGQEPEAGLPDEPGQVAAAAVARCPGNRHDGALPDLRRRRRIGARRPRASGPLCRPEVGVPSRHATRAVWRLAPRGRDYRAAKNRWIRPTPSSITASEVA